MTPAQQKALSDGMKRHWRSRREATAPSSHVDGADLVRLIVRRTSRSQVITDADHLADDLGLDALDGVELAIALELGCRVDLDKAAFSNCATVGDLVALVARTIEKGRQ